MIEAHDPKRKKGYQEKRVALGNVVVPRVATIEDGKGLGQIEVEEAKGRKSPLAVIQTVDER